MFIEVFVYRRVLESKAKYYDEVVKGSVIPGKYCSSSF
jgi:hypothetical protein